MGFLEQMKELEFLGTEFATWLVVETAQERGPAEWGECQPCALQVTGPIALEGLGRGAAQVALRGEDLLQSPELRAALAEGKQVHKVKLAIDLEDEHWQATLDAKTLEWRSVKLTVPLLPDLAEFAFLRAQAFERLGRFLDEWFAAFLRRRMNPRQWDAAIGTFRKFAASTPSAK